MFFNNNNSDDLPPVQRTIIGKLYLIAALLSLVLFFYSHAEFMPEKLFYIPCACAFVLSLFCKTPKDWATPYITGFVVVSVLSDIFNLTLPESLDSALLRQSMGIFCFSKLRFFDLKNTIKWFALISPLIVFSFYQFSSPFGSVYERYAGFSGDPNFFAMSLTLLIAINFIYIHTCKPNRIWKYVSIATIVGTFPLFLAGQSRAGIIALGVLLLFYFGYLGRYNKKASIALIALTIVFSGSFIMRFSETIDAFGDRFDDMGGGGGRTVQIYGILASYAVNPFHFITGIGIDNSPTSIQEFRAVTNYNIHNTYLSVLFGQGIVSLCLFLMMLFKTTKKCLKVENWQIYTGLMLSLILNASSVPSSAYTTFWWTLFFAMSALKYPLREQKSHWFFS